MTRIGYGEDMRRFRAEKTREHVRLFKKQYRVDNSRLFERLDYWLSESTIIIAGSMAEGLTLWFKSDSDLLHVLNSVLCVETGINIQTIPNGMGVYRMDTRVYPGHCRLLLERQKHANLACIKNALCDNGYGVVLLSSS
ncbi:hypothetical protein DPMN_039634 [Dreissena polymorpha]|uniref:Uncharacterized protein n=1 Tax=Dreissena polymorpha TaxID=45954 RepID=A0A9D4HUG0_DREPO|nr:hypothetical protein DPMN_039634 [Dreissena polymorpha]